MMMRLQLFGRSPHSLSCLVLAVALSLGLPLKAIAVERETILSLIQDTAPPDLRFLQPEAVPADGSVITADTVSQTDLTLPSLWWADEQFGGKLLNNWFAFTGSNGETRRVDLIVNQQIWSLYNYLERYTFINQLGTAAQEFGYSTRVYNQQQEPLAAYICEFPVAEIDAQRLVSPDDLPEELPQSDCAILLDSFGQGGLTGQTNPFERFTTPQ
ncbi:hypothetical protein H6F95_26605 [Cyanobacteria bacterium FACHB-471]|nr:hypothetical protein [Cyanobacteria bacterium FACHB-471]